MCALRTNSPLPYSPLLFPFLSSPSFSFLFLPTLFFSFLSFLLFPSLPYSFLSFLLFPLFSSHSSLSFSSLLSPTLSSLTFSFLLFPSLPYSFLLIPVVRHSVLHFPFQLHSSPFCSFNLIHFNYSSSLYYYVYYSSYRTHYSHNH